MESLEKLTWISDRIYTTVSRETTHALFTNGYEDDFGAIASALGGLARMYRDYKISDGYRIQV